MKKLMIIAAIVCAAAANAATVNWKSGTTIKPDGSTAAGSGTLNMYIWLVDSETYASTAVGDVWGTYGNTSLSAMSASADLKKESFGSATGGTAAATDVPNSTTLYGIIITAYDSDKDGTVDMYAANKAIGAVNDSGSPTSPTGLAKYIGGGTSGTAVSWQTAIPEPTSGLLMLVGLGALALRRRRA